MSHLSDDDLVLHYYGEGGARLVAAARHLGTCARCATAYAALRRTLDAVTPPELTSHEPVESASDLIALRQRLRARSRGQTAAGIGWPLAAGELGPIGLVWLAAALYPFSVPALFSSARLAQEHAPGLLLFALTLLWTCAGPLVAVLALHRVGADRFERRSTRLLVGGAVLAAVSPALFLVVSRIDRTLALNLGVWSWYATLAAGSLLALVRWPRASYPTVRVVFVHRVSALLLAAFVLAHVVNQAIAIVSLPAYAAMRSVMRVASEQPAIYALVVGAVAIQIVTGAAAGMRRVRAGAWAANFQVVSGWYLAAFLVIHVFTGLVLNLLHATPPVAATAAAPVAVTSLNLLSSARSAAQLPALLLGVAAFLFHVGVYARLAALAYFAEAAVRRLSYAAVLVGTTVVLAVGLALCGVQLTR